MGLLDILGEGFEVLGRGINFVVEDIIIDIGCGALDSAIDYAKDNPGKAIAMVGATVATGGMALAYAPAIATTIGAAGALGSCATTGAVISELTGVALTNASLAAIGGGALSVGGAGMVGGTTVVTVAGATAGAAVSGAALS